MIVYSYLGDDIMHIHDEFEFTIEEISKELKISKEKCRQILMMAMRKMKKIITKDSIDDLLKEIS
jgi:DNA-directed RNA polymerase sigma subunit (sigma70/sigma32)